LIPKATIDTIIETSRIEEVVSDFVSLKKRGSNLLGNCPFHNEKTPSFSVSPTKGIYKCFGCGKAGNSVNFIMEHEHYTYPEALRYLAKKYNILIEEEEQSPQFRAEENERESLYIVSSFAQKYYTQNLHEHPEGQAIGLTYFRERGFSDATIQKFQLGYSLNEWSAFTDTALKNSYRQEYLEKTGLTITGDNKRYDRFRGRVMFPIHNISGRVIAFGGRVLKTDPKSPKYVNSPETDIYHKSNVLYGAFFAKKSIIAEDNCYLVEGYTDVISMHQSGIENVVASSGTSLTVEQIRLIGRYTKNVTVLYDGDAAGIKASLRGIDLILEEGLNVKVVLFPDGDDPDSYSKKVSSTEFRAFIKASAKDFIVFKTGLLLNDAANDPIKKAALIRDIVETIARIPDPILRSTYIKECSVLLDISEHILLGELNKIHRSRLKKQAGKEVEDVNLPELPPEPEEIKIPRKEDSEFQERDLIRLLMLYGGKELLFLDKTDPREVIEHRVKVAEFIIGEFEKDRAFLEFENPLYTKVFDEISSAYASGVLHGEQYFVNHADPELSRLAVDLLSFPYELSENWEKHEIYVSTEETLLKQAVMTSIYSLRMRKLVKLISDNQQKLKEVSDEEEMYRLLQVQQKLDMVKKELSRELGIVILK
jgi:DNA primase